jgi:hypothetical protein
MTPLEVITYARQQYNSVSDDFFSDAELYKHVWAAQMDFARRAFAIERVYTSTTVADQREYELPTNSISIKRIEYDGKKLMPISFREDDTLTLTNSTTDATGTPQYYAVWNHTIYLRPVPDDALTLTIYSVNAPQEVTSTSSLEIPSMFHLDLVDYVLWRKAIKDKNFASASEYKKLWDDKLYRARQDHRRSKRGDGFAGVQDVEQLNETIIGAI